MSTCIRRMFVTKNIHHPRPMLRAARGRLSRPTPLAHRPIKGAHLTPILYSKSVLRQLPAHIRLHSCKSLTLRFPALAPTHFPTTSISLNHFASRCYSMSAQGPPQTRHGGYEEAIAALNTLQSNAAVIDAIRKSGGKLNDFALPEMVEYLERIGWKVGNTLFMSVC